MIRVRMKNPFWGVPSQNKNLQILGLRRSTMDDMKTFYMMTATIQCMCALDGSGWVPYNPYHSVVEVELSEGVWLENCALVENTDVRH